MIKVSQNTKSTPMVLAHFNKRELEDLDKAQGGKDIDPKTGVRQYKRLGEAFKDPDIQRRSLDKTRAFYAAGGRAQIEKMKKEGRYGDTEIALVPSHLADHLDRMIGGKCINPKTKHREYFLGALISGISAIARAAAPAIRAGVGAAGRAASHAGRAASKLAGSAAKVGSKVATNAAKYGKIAAPTLGKIGSGIMQAAPDVLNGYAQYQQAKDQQAQQARMMELMASMAQPRGYEPEYEPQQPQPQPQFNPYQSQGMNGLQNALYPSYDMPPMDPYSNPYFGY